MSKNPLVYPQKAQTVYFLNTLGKSLGHYLTLYDNIILLGDLNSEMSEEAMDDFSSLYNLKKPHKISHMLQKRL